MMNHYDADGPGRDRPDYDDAELDRLLARAMSGITAKLDAALDPGTGLADVYARSRAGMPDRPALTRHGRTARRRRWPAAAGETCAQIDLLNEMITPEGGQKPDWQFYLDHAGGELAGSAYLDLARDALTELRTGLASRSMDQRRAYELAGRAGQLISRADQAMQDTHGISLDDAAGDSAGMPVNGQVAVLRQMIRRLFAPAGDSSSLVPAR